MKANIGITNHKSFSYELNDLTRHAAIVGTTGSGKTVMCKILIEEALARNIPVIAIDPKGDIGGLAISNPQFDFRPFITSKIQAQKTADTYRSKAPALDIAPKTTIYTPKSSVGKAISLLPDLKAPANFRKLTEQDATILADFVEPISASILQLAGIKGTQANKAQSLISAILVAAWQQQQDLTFSTLIQNILAPPFEHIGSLPLEDFLKEQDRKKLAASINLILSSPAKIAWAKGDPVDVAKMFTPGNLSIIDLRFTATMEEKQFVIEQILQEIYKYLVKKGGTEKLKYILYIDELVGFLPPPPATNPAKKLLELLIRQARAFGLGIIVATQSPGDIDYKIFGNIGTRFVGRLRTDNDVEKVATAMDVTPSQLKTDVASLGIGQFVYNNAVRNSKHIIQARWLYSYHSGPLTPEHIGWINHPEHKPTVSDKLLIQQIPSKKKTPATSQHKSRTVPQKQLPGKKDLQALVRSIKPYANKTSVQISPGATTTTYHPYLKIVVEPKAFKGQVPALQGPWVFDLQSKLIHESNHLKNRTWMTVLPKTIQIPRTRIALPKCFRYTTSMAKNAIRTTYYLSTIDKFTSTSLKDVEKHNHQLLSLIAKQALDKIDRNEERNLRKLHEKITLNNRKSRSLSAKLTTHKTYRIIKRLFGTRKIVTQTKDMKQMDRIKQQAQKRNKQLHKKIAQLREANNKRRTALKQTIYQQALKRVKTVQYTPKNKDLIIHATLLLVPDTAQHK